MVAHVFPLSLLFPIHLLRVCRDNAIVFFIEPLNSTVLGHEIIFKDCVLLLHFDAFPPLFPVPEDLFRFLRSWKNLDINTKLAQFQALKVCIIPYPTRPWLPLTSAPSLIRTVMADDGCHFSAPCWSRTILGGGGDSLLIFPAPFCSSNARNLGKYMASKSTKNRRVLWVALMPLVWLTTILFGEHPNEILVVVSVPVPEVLVGIPEFLAQPSLLSVLCLADQTWVENELE